MTNVMVKRVLILCFGIAFGTLHAQDSLYIRGVLSGENSAGRKIGLQNIEVNPPQTQVRVTSEQGAFSFGVPVDKLAIYRLSLSNDNFLVIFMTGTSVELTLNSDKFSRDPVISGSEDTRILYEIAGRSSVFDKQKDSLSKAYGAAMKDPDKSGQLESIQDAYEQAASGHIAELSTDLTKYSASPAALFFIDKLDIDNDFPVYETVARSLSARFPDNKMVNELKSRVDLEKTLQPGNPAPEIEMPDPEGKLIKLSSLRGKVVLIDFWASWCGPCRRANPEVVKLYKKYKDKGFDIYGVSLDRDAAAWNAAIEKDGLEWTQVGDLKYWQCAGAVAYGVKSIPHTVLIDRNGIILARKLRGQALEDKLEEIFGKD